MVTQKRQKGNGKRKNFFGKVEKFLFSVYNTKNILLPHILWGERK